MYIDTLFAFSREIFNQENPLLQHCGAPLDRVPVTIGMMLSSAEDTVGVSGAAGLDVAPPAAAVTQRVWSLLLEGLDAISAAQEP